MIKIAICDDSSIDRDLLQEFLKNYYAKKNCFCEIVTYQNGEELLVTYQSCKNQFDLIFLDIYMCHLNGIETAEKIREFDEKVKIIFCTVSQEHAIDSYDVYAYGYLLKPFDTNRLELLLNKFTKQVIGSSINYIKVKADYSDHLIALQDIVYIESNNKMIYIHKKDHEVIRTYRKLSDIEIQLNEQMFLRCHQSYIVNLNYVTGIKNGDFSTTIGETIPIRKKDFYKIRAQYQNYLIENKHEK